MRRGVAWAVALPLMVTGSQTAHAIAYRIVYPDVQRRLLTLESSGHSYLAWMPLVLGLAGAAAVIALGVAVFDAARGRSHRALPAWAFALLPPLGFVLQELLELSLHTGTFGWHAFLEPTFVPGLLLQIPFAIAAALLARLLLRAAERVGHALATHPRSSSPPTRVSRRLTAVLPQRLRPSATHLAKRGPPLLAGR